jgi:hypothetical protein
MPASLPVSDPAGARRFRHDCPACRRPSDALKRFCLFDGDELVPLTLAVGAAAGAAGAMGGMGRWAPCASAPSASASN